MADEIVLSICLQEIETLIRQNRSADALGLCKYILRYYPKHLETYSLMAQALVQQSDLEGALDIYRRVLSADPENVAAYVGIARIFDGRAQLDQAVWNMERAYELVPTQADIRAELLLLYSRSEGTTRERLKLTRGALARLYVQEGLFAQAIREFREIASATPSRYDIRVVLAETLWRAGQTRQGADVAQALLEPLPYCLKANLILGTAWRESEIEESEGFLQRAQALDPSNQVAQKLLGDRSPLRPVQVKLPRYSSGAPLPLRAEEAKIVPAISEPTLDEEQNATIPPLVSFEQEPEPPAIVLDEKPELTEKVSAVTDTRDETEIEKIGLVPAGEEIVAPTPIPLTDLPPWLSRDTTASADSSRTESSTTVAPSHDIEESSPDWLTELRKTFSEKSDEGIPSQALPVPFIKIDEPFTNTETAPALSEPQPGAIDSVPEKHTLESDQVTSEQAPQIQVDHLDEVSAKTEPAPEMSETKIAPVDLVEESIATDQLTSQPSSQWLADRIKEPPAAMEPAPAVSEVEAASIDSVEETRALGSDPDMHEQSAQIPLDHIKEQTMEAEPVSLEPVDQESLTPKPIKETLPADAETVATVDEELPSDLSVVSIESRTEDESTEEEEIPEWLKEPSAEETKSAESEKPPEVKMPKWVEEISQRYWGEGKNADKGTVSGAQLGVGSEEADELEQKSESEPPSSESVLIEPESAIADETPATLPLVAPIVQESSMAQEPKPMPPNMKQQPKYYSRLAEAREHRDGNRWSDAFAEYDFVIRKAPRLANEVIMDLEALVAGGDAPLDAHRLLGDAYARAGRLNDALERYRFVYKRVKESNP